MLIHLKKLQIHFVRLVLHLIITLFTKNWPNAYLILFGATNHTQVLFFATLCRFILVFTNLSDVHWRGSTICASENNLRRATNIFAVSVFPSVYPAFKPYGKRGFA